MKIGNSITIKLMEHVNLYDYMKSVVPFKIYARMYVATWSRKIDLVSLVNDSYENR